MQHQAREERRHRRRPKAAEAGDVERFRVPLEGTAKGPATAKVTIVEFSDFQCPFCSRVDPDAWSSSRRSTRARSAWSSSTTRCPSTRTRRWPRRPRWPPSEQGKFWEMHDKLFANQQALKRPDLEKYAQELGLDMGKFKAGAGQQRVQGAHRRGHGRWPARSARSGTPAFFINGRMLSGAQPFDNFKKVIDEEIATRRQAARRGHADGQALRDAHGQRRARRRRRRRRARRRRARRRRHRGLQGRRRRRPDQGRQAAQGHHRRVLRLPVPVLHRASTRRSKQIEKDLRQRRRDRLQAQPAALPQQRHAGRRWPPRRPREQGKFWEMHDKLFANQQALDRADLEKYAQELGLDMAKFKAALDSEQVQGRASRRDMDDGRQVRRERHPDLLHQRPQLARRAAVRGVQGGHRRGDQEGRREAEGGRRRRAALRRAHQGRPGQGRRAAPPPQPRAGRARRRARVYKADIGDAPVKGPKDALVTIVQFSDFQCPFCSRVEPTLNKVMEEYKGKVRVVFKTSRCPSTRTPCPAAIAARAAGEQGKFWEMHDKLFANQQALDRASLEKYAAGARPEHGQVQGGARRRQVQGRRSRPTRPTGDKIGASGTPAFFINGTVPVGRAALRGVQGAASTRS